MASRQPVNKSKKAISRREFLKTLPMGGAFFLPFWGSGNLAEATRQQSGSSGFDTARESPSNQLLDLSPARWIWYPSGRTLQNTMILFRREFEVPTGVEKATGWILADSRYQLEVNGRRVQWGPAPADPRWPEADPMELTNLLRPGNNVIGVQVLFYGQGDGTWPVGKPGLLFSLELEIPGRENLLLISDSQWQAALATAWEPGRYKRWYLRSFQEEFDARKFPYGWSEIDYDPDDNWLQAMELNGSADKPSICTSYPEYMLQIRGDEQTTALFPRSVPPLDEKFVPVIGLAEACTIHWKRPSGEYFKMLTPDSFIASPPPAVRKPKPGTWQVELNGESAVALTYQLDEQVVGWPYFTIEAPAGTVVELMVQEAHEVGGPPLLNTHFNSWTRFTCREGLNRFETFDYESLRWLQLHIHGTAGRVTIRAVGVRRRIYPWPNAPEVTVNDPALQKLIDASVNTLNNSAQETIVDGMGRERQQYSGDVGHQLHAIYYTFGEYRQPARYLKTFSQGITTDGYFLDCWPAYDRLARLMERQVDLTQWGPLLDHGVGFIFDNYHHYMYSGRLSDLDESYPRLLRFARYLESIQEETGLLPVENLGIPTVWIDHIAYQQQRHKQCAFNLYAAAMLEHALAPLCAAFGDASSQRQATWLGRSILSATVRYFWSNKHNMFVNNLPWLSEEGQIRLDDRALATSVLFDQCPGRKIDGAVKALVNCPPEMGFSYPANAGWRLWALGKAGRANVILQDLRERWATLDSVRLNNTLQENWEVTPDSGAEWSHCPVAPLYVLFMNIAGLQPLEPGFRRYEIRPQPADLGKMDLTAHLGQGQLRFQSLGKKGQREITLTTPDSGQGELVVHKEERLDLPRLSDPTIPGHIRYVLPAGQTVNLQLRYT